MEKLKMKITMGFLVSSMKMYVFRLIKKLDNNGESF